MLFNNKNTIQKGFTLIELMVVIAIIGMLSSIVLAAMDKARSRARDSRRISEIHAIKTALELYRDSHGFYPTVTLNNSPEGSGCWWDWQAGNSADAGSVPFLKALSDEGYISKVPVETYFNGGCTYRYIKFPGSWWSPACTDYMNTDVAVLYVQLENPRQSATGAAPTCITNAGWGEAAVLPNDFGYNDPNGYLVVLREI